MHDATLYTYIYIYIYASDGGDGDADGGRDDVGDGAGDACRR